MQPSRKTALEDVLEKQMQGQKLGKVTSFKYLGAIASDEGSKPEVLSRITQATAEANLERYVASVLKP